MSEPTLQASPAEMKRHRDDIDKIKQGSSLSSLSGSRIAGLRDGLRKIVECEQGEVSNGQAIVLMREIARLTLKADDIRSENKLNT